MKEFRAFRIHTKPNFRSGIEKINLDELSPGEVVIEGHYSSVNYKDALAGTGKSKILRRSPLNGGIDVSGVVVDSLDARFNSGDEVLVTGCGLSEIHDGGYSEVVRVPADWVVPIPKGLNLYEAMALGTAGFTAALAIQRMQENHQIPEGGSILVTGASGGVGSFSVSMLSALNYEVVALSGKSEATEYLLSLGASRVLNRHNLQQGEHPLEKALWGGAIDNVGGELLSWLVRSTKPWGNIVSIGLAGGTAFQSTVMPFILRGVSLLGVSSSNCPYPRRLKAWQRLGKDLYPKNLAAIVSEVIYMEQLPAIFARMIASQVIGRVVVEIKS